MTGKELKTLRKQRGLTQKQFSEVLGVELRTYQNWEVKDTLLERNAYYVKLILKKDDELHSKT